VLNCVGHRPAEGILRAQDRNLRRKRRLEKNRADNETGHMQCLMILPTGNHSDSAMPIHLPMHRLPPSLILVRRSAADSLIPAYHDWAGLRYESGKQLAAAFRSSSINDWVLSYGLMSRRDGPGFLVRCFPTTTIQTGKYRDRKPSVQIHRPFRQHRTVAFIACLHGWDFTISV
jgi:hypothetical protein